MQVTPLHTAVITPSELSLEALLDKYVDNVDEGCVLAITSKIVALCEGSVVKMSDADKESLIAQQATHYTPASFSPYGYHFTITDHTLIAAAGIDESNGDDHYILWPKDAQATANQVWTYLKQRFGLRSVGVVITDSSSQPMRRGSIGIALAHSGFKALNDYRETEDLFGRPYSVSVANISGGIAAAATVAMGEGNEQTPLCLLGDLPFVKFQDHAPDQTELGEIRMTLETDLYAPFLKTIPWQRGDS